MITFFIELALVFVGFSFKERMYTLIQEEMSKSVNSTQPGVMKTWNIVQREVTLWIFYSINFCFFLWSLDLIFSFETKILKKSSNAAASQVHKAIFYFSSLAFLRSHTQILTLITFVYFFYLKGPIDWQRRGSFMPNSCCETDIGCPSEENPLFMNGCNQVLTVWANENLSILATIALVISIFQIFGTTFSCLLAKSIKRGYEVIHFHH